jgi:hypothetical protein
MDSDTTTAKPMSPESLVCASRRRLLRAGLLTAIPRMSLHLALQKLTLSVKNPMRVELGLLPLKAVSPKDYDNVRFGLTANVCCGVHLSVICETFAYNTT